MAQTARASFKNSRITPRSATLSSEVDQVNVLTSSPNTLVAPANVNRTYLTIRNQNATAGEDLRYDYFDNPNMLTEGFLLKASEAVDLDTTSAVYARAATANVILSTDEGSG